MHRNTIRAAALGLLSIIISGCADTTVEPEYVIAPQDYVVVMPFLDLGHPDRWSSSRGNDLARRTTEVLAQKADFKVRPYEDVLALFQAENLSSIDPADVAALCRADYAIVCEVEKYELEDAHRVNIPHGSSRVRVRLFKVVHRDAAEARRVRAEHERQRLLRVNAGLPPEEVLEGGEFVHIGTVEAVFPSDFTQRYDRVSMTVAEVEEGLRQATARRVAQLYHEHERERLPRDG
jgi:hypothetical protein